MKNPIQRATEEFLEECDAFWRRKHGRVLPIIAHYSQRKDLIAALRVQEYAPDNRRPLFLWEAAFEEADSYFDGLMQAVERDYNLIREGVVEEGVTLGVLTMGNASDGSALNPMHRAALCIAALLSEFLDGILVALVPEKFADRDRWRDSMEAWISLPWPDNVRLAVFDVPGGPLKGILGRKGAHFAVDEGLLADYYRSLCPPRNDGGNGSSGAPPVPPSTLNGSTGNGVATLVLPQQPPRLGSGGNGGSTLVLQPLPALGCNGENGASTLVLADQHALDGNGGPGARAPIVPQAGPALAKPETGAKVRALVIEAALESRNGEHLRAAQRFQQARTLCQAEGLALEEAVVTVALGGACLAAGQFDLAVKGFEKGASLASPIGAWQVTAQAWLGAGGVYTVQKQHELAALAYEAAGKAAEQAGSPVLQIEALRLAGLCHLTAGSEGKAAIAWDTAIRIGAAQAPEVRKASTFRLTAKALTDLLTRRGLHVQAAQIAALESPDLSPA